MICHEIPEGSRSNLYSFFNLAAKWGWVIKATPWPIYRGKDPVPVVYEIGWAPEPVWTGAENLAPTRIPSPDRPARTDGLRYPAHYLQK